VTSPRISHGRAHKEDRELGAVTRSFVEYHVGTEEVLRVEAGLV
jgi:hypothetical protein